LGQHRLNWFVYSTGCVAKLIGSIILNFDAAPRGATLNLAQLGEMADPDPDSY